MQTSDAVLLCSLLLTAEHCWYLVSLLTAKCSETLSESTAVLGMTSGILVHIPQVQKNTWVGKPEGGLG